MLQITDVFFRLQDVHKRSQLSIFDGILGIKGINEYYTGTAFQQIQMMASLQTKAYDLELRKNKVFLEEVIAWFFKQYLKEEFNVIGFHFHPTTPTTTYFEKCKLLATEIDGILKQFKIWVEGEIDSELLQLSTEHMFFENIPSKIEKKYIYCNSDECQTAMNILFSNQSPVYYTEKYKDEKDCFYELVKTHHPKIDDFMRFQTDTINWLVKHRILQIDEQGFLYLERKTILLKELYYNEVICKTYMGEYNDEIEELEKTGMIGYESTLFSKPEQEYLNYLFNKSEFSNGLDLRNSYLHNTAVDNEKQNIDDYYIFIRMLLFIVIKMNEEFCVCKKEEKNKGESFLTKD